MNPLKPVYSADELPEGLKDYYSEQSDGSFKINLEGGVKTQADVDRAMGAMEKQKKLRIELEKKLSEFPEDFDAERWDKLKDYDPDNPPSGGDDPDFQQKLAAAVREKERELRTQVEDSYKKKLEEVELKEQSILKAHKESWIKTQLIEKFGFSDPKKLRWMLLDIEAGEHPELKKKLESIQVETQNGVPTIVGGDLKDKQGAIEVLENITSSDVVKDYKPAPDTSGGGAGNSAGSGRPAGVKSKKDLANVEAKTKFVAEHGLEAWKQLPSE